MKAREGKLLTLAAIQEEARRLVIPAKDERDVYNIIQTIRRWFPDYIFASAYNIGYVVIKRPPNVTRETAKCKDLPPVRVEVIENSDPR